MVTFPNEEIGYNGIECKYSDIKLGTFLYNLLLVYLTQCIVVYKLTGSFFNRLKLKGPQ